MADTNIVDPFGIMGDQPDPNPAAQMAKAILAASMLVGLPMTSIAGHAIPGASKAGGLAGLASALAGLMGKFGQGGESELMQNARLIAPGEVGNTVGGASRVISKSPEYDKAVLSQMQQGGRGLSPGQMAAVGLPLAAGASLAGATGAPQGAIQGVGQMKLENDLANAARQGLSATAAYQQVLGQNTPPTGEAAQDFVQMYGSYFPGGQLPTNLNDMTGTNTGQGVPTQANNPAMTTLNNVPQPGDMSGQTRDSTGAGGAATPGGGSPPTQKVTIESPVQAGAQPTIGAAANGAPLPSGGLQPGPEQQAFQYDLTQPDRAIQNAVGAQGGPTYGPMANWLSQYLSQVIPMALANGTTGGAGLRDMIQGVPNSQMGAGDIMGKLMGQESSMAQAMQASPGTAPERLPGFQPSWGYLAQLEQDPSKFGQLAAQAMMAGPQGMSPGMAALNGNFLGQIMQRQYNTGMNPSFAQGNPMALNYLGRMLGFQAQ